MGTQGIDWREIESTCKPRIIVGLVKNDKQSIAKTIVNWIKSKVNTFLGEIREAFSLVLNPVISAA